MENVIEKNNTKKVYGEYTIGFSSKINVDEMYSFLLNNTDHNRRPNSAVYVRKEDVFKREVSNGHFVIMRRKSTNEIFAICGGYTYPFSLTIEENGEPKRVIEIGTLLSIDRKTDLSSVDNQNPKKIVLEILASLTVLNFTRKAGKDVGDQKLEFDTFVLNVQKKEDLKDIRYRLTKPPLSCKRIMYPTKAMEKIIGDTTTSPKDFINREKCYYELPPSSLPNIAKFIHDCWFTKSLTSINNGEKSSVHIYLNIDEDMIQFIKSVYEHSTIFEGELWPGYMDLKSTLSPQNQKLHNG